MTELRPVTAADAETAAALMAAADLAELGEVDTTVEDVRADWRAQGFDLARDAVLALDAGQPVGFAMLREGKVVSAAASPAVDEALLDWAEARAAELGLDRHQQYVGRDAARRARLQARGYTRVRSYHRLVRTLTGEERPPDGLALRALDPEHDDLHPISAAAFSSVPDYEPEAPERFREEHLAAHDLDPGLSRVAAGRGFALVRRWEEGDAAYVDLLAVHPEARGRGLGTALLRAVFAEAAAAGLREVTLNVASDNPRAGRLYARAGMAERWRIDAYEKPLPH